MGQATSGQTSTAKNDSGVQPSVPGKPSTAHPFKPNDQGLAHPPSSEGVPDSHTDAVRRVLFQYLKRQTRQRTGNVPGLYLAEMRKCLDDPDRFRLNFQYWTFAARPPVSPVFAHDTMQWIDRYRDDRDMLDKLVHSLEAIHSPVFSGGSGLKQAPYKRSDHELVGGDTPTAFKSAIVLLTNDLKQVLIRADRHNFPFSKLPSSPTPAPVAHAFQGLALQKAVQGFKSQMGFSVAATYRFLGERTFDGHILYLCQLPTEKKPGQVMGKPSKWVSLTKTMPTDFANPQAWKTVLQFPPRVRDFTYTASTLPQMRRILVYAQSPDGLATTLGRLRGKDVVYVLFTSKAKNAPVQPTMNNESEFAHPVTVLPSTKPVSYYVRVLGITHLYVESCSKEASKTHGFEESLCKTLSAQFPKVKLYDNLKQWSLASTKPMERVNPALVAKQQGTPGFTAWLHKTYKTHLDRLGALPFECTPDRKMYRSQELAVFLAGPKCPAISRFLVVHMTGSGKTRIMQTLLGLYHRSDMPKLVLVPTRGLQRNFFNDLVTTDTALSTFVRKTISEIPETGKIRADILENTRPKVNELLAMRQSSGRYTLPKYRKYLRDKKAGIVQPPYGSEDWSPGSPLRCEYFNSIVNMFKPVDDLETFESQLKAGDPCVPVASMDSHRMFKPSYRYHQDGVKDGSKKIRNPFDNKIIVIDEIHKLLAEKTEKQTQREMLVLMLKYARDSVVIGLTATPLLSEDTENSKVLDMIKGVNADKKTDEGYISYFNELVQPLFPTTIPNLFQRIHGGKIPVLGRVVFSPLYGPNFEKYLDRVQNLRGDPSAKPSTKDMVALQTFLNTIYTNGSAGKHGAKLVGTNLKDFAANANKLDCLDKLLNQSTTEKTLVLFAGGARSYLEYVKRKYKGRLIQGEDAKPTTKSDRMGFMFGLSNPKKVKAQEDLLSWFNMDYNLKGDYIRVMCANAKRFGTGVNFVGIRRIILVNIPSDVTTYLQEVGRTMRSCVYAPLPKEDQNVHVDIMVATFDPLRTLDDIMDAEQYGVLKRQHNTNIRDPKLTWDEMNLRSLYEHVDKEVSRTKRLISDHAVDKKWLQDLVPRKDVDPGSDESKYVVYCDSSQASDFFEARNEKQRAANQKVKPKEITIPKGKTGTLAETLGNLNVPEKPDPSGVDMLDPMVRTFGSVVSAPSDMIDALLHTNALGLLIKGPFDFEKDVDAYIARAHTRWRQLAKHVPSFQSVNSIHVYLLPSKSITLFAYVPNVLVDPDSINVSAIASALQLDETVMRSKGTPYPQPTPTTQTDPQSAQTAQPTPQSPQPTQTAQPTPQSKPEPEVSSDKIIESILNEMDAEAYGLPPPSRSQPKQTIDPNQQAIIFVNMYFPDIRIILENKVLTYEEYKFQTVYVTGVLNRVKQVLARFFQPHDKQIKIQGTRSQISAQVQNVPLVWLESMRSEEHRLYSQLEHMETLGSQGGWQIMPYTGKLEISLKPVQLETTGYLEPPEILSVNSGDVYLDEDDSNARVQIKKAPYKLPVHMNGTVFDSNYEFVQARARGDSFVYLSNFDPPLIAPIKTYASIKDFAVRASTGEWNALWKFVNRIRAQFAPDRVYISTDPVPERGHFALNVLAGPGYPAWKLDEWRLRTLEQKELEKVAQIGETPLQAKTENTPLRLPAIELPSERKEIPLAGSKMQAKQTSQQALVTLIVVFEKLAGVNQILLAERSNAIETKLLLPMARVGRDIVGTDEAVHQVLSKAVQREALHPVETKWLRKDVDPVALVKLSPGTEIDFLSYSPNGHFTNFRPWQASNLLTQTLPDEIDGRSLEILMMYRDDIQKMAL